MFYKNKTIFILLVLSSIIIGTFSFVEIPVHASFQHLSNEDLQSTENQDYYNYPPLVLKIDSGISSSQQFGVGLEGFSYDQLNRADEANAYWVRQNVFNWKLIEPIRTEPPEYDWSSVDEAWIQEASARGLEIIATIKYTPSWAQKYAGVSCGPIKEEKLDEYAQFVQELVNRYGQFIKYWEFGNEPDVDPDLVDDDNPFGCWGDEGDYYYGGTYYGKMLSYVYPTIKNADPESQVLVGGLLLDCEPDYDYQNGYDCESNRAGRFFEGILRYDEDPNDGEFDGGKYFDIIPYHGFNGYFTASRLRYDEITSKPWHHRGGHVLGKADFLREVMAKPAYNINKPIMLNETSLLCYQDCEPPSNDFLEAQAEYVVWVNVRNMATGILGTIWHTLPGPGWRNGGLLDNGPRPAYYSFQFMAEELRNAEFVEKTNEEVGTCADLRAYKFLKGGRQIWVMWTGDEIDCDFTLPSETLRVFDIYGNDITPTGGELTIRAPVYVEFPLEVYLYLPLVLKNY
jgi:hypothetical protein